MWTRLSTRRLIHTTTQCCVRSGRHKTTPKKNKPLTYEQATPPHLIGVTKSWNSWNGSIDACGMKKTRAELAVEDQLIRRLVAGTWHKTLLSEVLIKRQHNRVVIAGIVCPLPSVEVIYFQIGYMEHLLSRLLNCSVTIELQAVRSRNEVVYKYI